MNPAWVTAITALAAIVLGLLGWAGRKAWNGFRRTDQFLEDWAGTPADGGHSARPGVMERLANLEHSMADVRSQVNLNSGHSLRDEIQRTEAAVGTLTGKVADLQVSVEELKARP